MSDFQTSNDHFPLLCAVVGFVAIMWALAENALDGLVVIAYHKCGGKQFSTEIPRSLSRKIVFLKKCFENLPPLSPYREKGSRLIESAACLGKRRNDLIHAALARMPKSDKIDFRKLNYTGTMHHVRNMNFNIQDLDTLGKEIRDLGAELAPFVHDLTMHFRTPQRSG